MIKKAIFAGGIGLALLALLFGRDACSYVATGWGRVHDSVKDQIPVQFELDRARRMIERLDPEVRRNMHVIAKEEVAIQRLAQQVEQFEARQSREKENLLQLSQDLQSGETRLVYAGRTYSAHEVQEDLTNRFDRYKVNDQTLDNLRKVLQSRQQGLEAARQKLEQMLAVKQQLLADVANLEARQKMVEVAQTASAVTFDDSRLSRTKELLDQIRTRIAVSERLVGAEQELRGAIQVDEPIQEELASEIARYFDQQPGAPALAQTE